MTDFDSVCRYPAHDDLRTFDHRFQVTVVSYCYGEEPIELVNRSFDDFGHAKKFYEQMKTQYAAVVTAETKDYEDIRIYARKTGYHIIKPDCCATCKWACPIDSRNSLFDDWKANRKGKFICMNGKLYQPDALADGQERDGSKPADIRPQVEAMGLCNGFVRCPVFAKYLHSGELPTF